ncbi:MAG TPA: S53 family peptidase [Candidatus Xenobia bacterium]|jgi:kumamolisin
MNALSALSARSSRPAPAQSPAAEPERQELKGSACPGTAQAQRLGPCDPQQKMQVSVLLNRTSDYRMPEGPFQAVSREEMAKHGASPAQMQDVKQFAKQFGLSVASLDPKTRTVKLEGNASSFNKAFGVQLNQYKDAAGQTFRAYEGKLKMPGALAGQVEGVFGLSNKPIAKQQSIISPATKGGGYSPVDVAKMYNFPKGTDGTGQTIGIIELGGGYKDADLQQYFKSLGVKAPNVKAVSVDGAQNAPTGTANGPDGEVDLDIEVVGAVAPGANVVVYFAPNTDQGFIDAINQAAHDTENKPNALSISWGAPEKEWTADGMTSMSNAIKDAAAMGVNVFAASGDNGSKDREKDGQNHADFPAAAPYSIGTGGTRIKTSNGQITSETTWNDGFMGGAGGGGVSDVFPEPQWQKDGAKVPTPATAGGGRGVPDVAGNASPFSGYNVLVDGQSMSIGGTSAVAPLYAALAARLGQGLGAPLGFLAPALYTPDVAKTFNDITTGNNGAFKAGPGWDAATGLGSPDGEKLLGALKQLHQSVT